MKADIVERLRNTTFLQVSHPHFAPIAEAAHEAADKIESLQARLRDESKAREGREALLRENESLRSRLAEIEALREQIRGMMKVGLETEAELIALRSRLDSAQLELTHAANTCAEQQCRAENAEARLAEAEALLREARPCLYLVQDDQIAADIDAFLSNNG